MEQVLGGFEREHTALHRVRGDVPAHLFLESCSPVFAQVLAREYFDPEPRQLATYDGKPLEPTRMFFEVSDGPALRRRLLDCRDLVPTSASGPASDSNRRPLAVAGHGSRGASAHSATDRSDVLARSPTRVRRLTCLMSEERNLGPQPIEGILERHGLSANDLVNASGEQLTHKMVARAVKGRRLTTNAMAKVVRALNRSAASAYTEAELFTYSPARRDPGEE